MACSYMPNMLITMTRQGKFIPVMLTPFLEDGAVDYKGLEKLTQFYLDAGVKGLFANCLSSEMFELTPEERLEVTRTVVRVVDGKVPVVSTGTFGGPIAEQAAFVKEIYATGVSAVIAITSLLAEESDSDEVLDQNVMELLDQTPGVPIGFYECPVPYKRVLKPEQLAKYVATGRVVYHKDTCLDLEAVKQKMALCDKGAFELYDAYMVNAVSSQVAGAAGLSCIQGNFMPELVVWLCDHYADESKAEQVAAVQSFFVDNMDVMHAVYPIISKYFLQKRGFPISLKTRREVGEFTPAIAADIDGLFERYQILKNQIGLEEASF